jgi:CubicO group peptidase (beta-lactamase class C family)
MKTRIYFTSIFILLFLLTGCRTPKSISISIKDPDYWPTNGFQSSSPEAQGMDSSLLADMLEEINTNQTHIHSILVIRNGYLVTEAYFHPYTRDTKSQIQSVTKSVIGALVGISVKDGLIKDEHGTLLSFFPNRMVANPSQNKDSIQLEHLLTMSSGFPCQEFTDSGQTMEQTAGWVQFMLDMPVDNPPGKSFGYCDGNPHLLSAIIEITTGMTAREYANQKLFAPLGIPEVKEADWWADPQGFSDGGYGLFLTPLDLAKIGFLYLHNGMWNNQQVLSKNWVSASTTPYIQKPEGPWYGYLWTIYPEAGHYAALGLGGQQIHVFPSENLVVVTTAELETFMEAPEIEHMLTDYILASIKSSSALPENQAGATRLKSAVQFATNPIQDVPQLPPTAYEISGKMYTLEQNPNGWENLAFTFEPGSRVAMVTVNNDPNQEEIGLDNIYRLGKSTPNHMMRGRWTDDHTFIIDYVLLDGYSGTTQIQFSFIENNLEANIQQLIFKGQPTSIKGSR